MSGDPPQPDVDSDDDSPGRAEDAAEAPEGAPSVPPVPSTETLRDAPSRLPERVGRYHVKSVIASGGMGTVYEAGPHQPDPYSDGEGAAITEAVPFFAMEYIPNAKPITQYAKEKKLSARQRLKLFAQVCDAIHRGHQKGIIHRDLKPSNILVDAQGQVKIIDFGVARSTDSDLAVATLQTDVGQSQ